MEPLAPPPLALPVSKTILPVLEPAAPPPVLMVTPPELPPPVAAPVERIVLAVPLAAAGVVMVSEVLPAPVSGPVMVRVEVPVNEISPESPSVPLTLRVYCGEMLPMPTKPAEVMRIFSVSAAPVPNNMAAELVRALKIKLPVSAKIATSPSPVVKLEYSPPTYE